MSCINSVRYKVTLWSHSQLCGHCQKCGHTMEPSPNSAPWVNQGKIKRRKNSSCLIFHHGNLTFATLSSYVGEFPQVWTSAAERVSLRLWQTQRRVPLLWKALSLTSESSGSAQVGKERESGKAHGTINSAQIPATDCSVLTPLWKQESLLSFHFSSMEKAE